MRHVVCFALNFRLWMFIVQCSVQLSVRWLFRICCLVHLYVCLFCMFTSPKPFAFSSCSLTLLSHSSCALSFERKNTVHLASHRISTTSLFSTLFVAFRFHSYKLPLLLTVSDAIAVALFRYGCSANRAHRLKVELWTRWQKVDCRRRPRVFAIASLSLFDYSSFWTLLERAYMCSVERSQRTSSLVFEVRKAALPFDEVRFRSFSFGCRAHNSPFTLFPSVAACPRYSSSLRFTPLTSSMSSLSGCSFFEIHSMQYTMCPCVYCTTISLSLSAWFTRSYEINPRLPGWLGPKLRCCSTLFQTSMSLCELVYSCVFCVALERETQVQKNEKEKLFLCSSSFSLAWKIDSHI